MRDRRNERRIVQTRTVAPCELDTCHETPKIKYKYCVWAPQNKKGDSRIIHEHILAVLGLESVFLGRGRAARKSLLEGKSLLVDPLDWQILPCRFAPAARLARKSLLEQISPYQETPTT